MEIEEWQMINGMSSNARNHGYVSVNSCENICYCDKRQSSRFIFSLNAGFFFIIIVLFIDTLGIVAGLKTAWEEDRRMLAANFLFRYSCVRGVRRHHSHIAVTFLLLNICKKYNLGLIFCFMKRT